MQDPVCEICGDPTDATVCRGEISSLAGYLRPVIAVAGEVETTVARLARYGARGGQAVQPADEDLGSGPANRAMPVTVFGWPASKEGRQRGALIETELPFHPGTAKRAYAAINTITTVARDICETRGIDVPMPGPVAGPLCRSGWGCNHPTCDWIRARTVDHPAARAATFLLTQLEWIRHHPDAARFVDELSAAAATLRRCVDRPPAMVIVGMCDCGQYLYAREGQAVATCGECKSRWEVATSREILKAALLDRLFTAAEAAVLMMKFEMTVNRNRTRKLIVMWAQRGLISAHGEVDGSPTYRLGDIIDRAARSVAA